MVEIEPVGFAEIGLGGWVCEKELMKDDFQVFDLNLVKWGKLREERVWRGEIKNLVFVLDTLCLKHLSDLPVELLSK